MSGFVYIAKNDYIPDVVKIGCTQNLERRIKQLSSSSSVPGDFYCVYSVEVSGFITLEKNTHLNFSDSRVNPSKEFFRLEYTEVINYLEKESKKKFYEKEIYCRKKEGMKSKLPFRNLPEVLSKNEILRISGLSEDMLKLYLQRWVKSGDLKKAGQRSGVYYNLTADPEWRNHIPKAVVKRFPIATLVGPTVLHAYGCQTQIPSKMWFALPPMSSYPQMDGVQWVPRPQKWFDDFLPEDNLYGVRSLSPKQALEDGLLFQEKQNLWKPDLDDIDLEEVEYETSKIKKEKMKF